ncbi:MAG: hypothetical protein ACKO7N_04965 [Candidatus Nitrosotenuis sp.]
MDYKQLLTHIQQTLADSYNDINIFELGPSTMKNLDDLYGDDEENTTLNDTNADMYQAMCNIANKMHAIISNIRNPKTRTFLTGGDLPVTLANMSSRVDELHDMMVNMPLDDSDKTLISKETVADIDQRGNNDTMSGSKPGLWDNIRKKKEREGKNYRPAKPGDKDRPNFQQWKKLTKKQ